MEMEGNLDLVAGFHALFEYVWREEDDRERNWVDLPHEVLEDILSRLSLKEAARTCILSRAWRYVWANTVDLILTVRPTRHYPNSYDPLDMETLPLDRSLDISHLEELDCQRYVDMVDNALHVFRSPFLKTFMLSFPLNSKFSNKIDDWVHFAIQRNVARLILDFSPGFLDMFDDCYNISSIIEGLEANQAFFVRNLRVLVLKGVGITGGQIESVLRWCRHLEKLSIVDSHFLVTLRVIHPSWTLKNIEIWDCPCLERLEISDSRLTSLLYRGQCIDLTVNEVPELVKVVILENDGYTATLCDIRRLVFTQIASCLRRLVFLSMDIMCMNITSVFVVPKLPNVKHLSLMFDPVERMIFPQLASFMSASPSLQTLVLRCYSSEEDEESTEDEEEEEVTEEQEFKGAVQFEPHDSLKVLHIVGQCNSKNAAQIGLKISNGCVALQDILVDPVDDDDDDDEGESGGEHAMHMLREKLPSSVGFHCSCKNCHCSCKRCNSV